MSRTVVFLDIDGVLNHLQTFKGMSRVKLDRACIQRLERLCEMADAQIVVSSTWRVRPNALAYLRATFVEFGLTKPELVIDVTPNLDHQRADGLWISPPRGDEIASWLGEHDDVTRFVILDDDADMGRLTWFLVQTSFDTGLLDVHLARAMHVLDKQTGHGARIRALVTDVAAAVQVAPAVPPAPAGGSR